MNANFSRPLAAAATAGLLALAAPAVQAQVGAGFYAPFDAMDELSGAPTGGGGVGALGMDRARALPGAPGGPPPADPFAFGDEGGGGFDMYGYGGGAGAYDPYGPGAMGYGGQFGQFGGGPQAGWELEPEPDTLVAWGGERIYCHRTGVLLQDAREFRIFADQAGAYYDDGETGHDAHAGDNVYTNITISRAYVSPEAHVVRTRLVRAIELAAELNPREFQMVPIATTEPRNPFPQMRDLQLDQDARLRNWIDSFLREYRIDPDDPDSEMYRTHLPAPPRAPNVPMPSNFTPHVPDSDDFQGMGPGMMGGPGGFYGGEPGMGMGMGASGAYF